MEREILRTIAEWEEERAMPYVTSIERMGREQGLTEGLMMGREEGKRAAVRRIVERRFGLPPETLAAHIAQADEPTLDALLDRAIAATSLDEL